MGKFFHPFHQFPAGMDQYLPLKIRDRPTLPQLWHSYIGQVTSELAPRSPSQALNHRVHEQRLVLLCD
jgi:hypothetical protein